MDRFDATHSSANPPAQPASAEAAAAAAEAAPGGGGGAPAVVDSTDGGDGVDTMIIRLQNQCGDRVHFRVRTSTQFGVVANAYCMLTGMEMSDLRFVFDRVRCHFYDTIAGIGMEDGDTVDVLVEQRGD